MEPCGAGRKRPTCDANGEAMSFRNLSPVESWGVFVEEEEESAESDCRASSRRTADGTSCAAIVLEDGSEEADERCGQIGGRSGVKDGRGGYAMGRGGLFSSGRRALIEIDEVNISTTHARRVRKQETRGGMRSKAGVRWEVNMECSSRVDDGNLSDAWRDTYEARESAEKARQEREKRRENEPVRDLVAIVLQLTAAITLDTKTTTQVISDRTRHHDGRASGLPKDRRVRRHCSSRIATTVEDTAWVREAKKKRNIAAKLLPPNLTPPPVSRPKPDDHDDR
nr:hypothetical protein CFP56_62924 [Quercus suber]